MEKQKRGRPFQKGHERKGGRKKGVPNAPVLLLQMRYVLRRTEEKDTPAHKSLRKWLAEDTPGFMAKMAMLEREFAERPGYSAEYPEPGKSEAVENGDIMPVLERLIALALEDVKGAVNGKPVPGSGGVQQSVGGR